MEILIHKNLKLRPWNKRDRQALTLYGNNPKIAANMTDAFPSPYTMEAADEFIELVQAEDPYNILAIEFEGHACGGIGLHPDSGIHRKNAEMGYWLAEDFWGMGILSNVIPVMVKYGFQHWDIDRIYARPFGRNKASQRVLEKSGFTLEAEFKQNLIKNGMMEDELIYAIRRTN